MKKVVINGKNYELIKDNDKVFNDDEFMEKVTEYFEVFDYIFGDYAYDKLRLKGFYESNNKNFVKLLDNYIEKDNHTSWYNKYRSLTSCGYTGIIISLINVLIFGLLYSKVNLYLNIINSFVISSLVGLLFNILCDIKIKDNVGKYSFIKLLSLVLDISLMQVFYKMFNIEPILSKIITNIVILFISFVIIKLIFRKEEV